MDDSVRALRRELEEEKNLLQKQKTQQPTPKAPEQPSMGARIGKDIATGFTSDAGPAILRGIAGGVNEALDTLQSAALFLQRFMQAGTYGGNLEKDGKPLPPPGPRPDPFGLEAASKKEVYGAGGNRATGTVPIGPRIQIGSHIPEVESYTGGFIQGIHQFIIGYLTSAKALNAAGMANRWARGAAAGISADAFFVDPEDQNLANLWQKLPSWAQNAMVDYLASKDPDAEAENRFKNALTGLIPGIAIEGLATIVRGWRNWRKAGLSEKPAGSPPPNAPASAKAQEPPVDVTTSRPSQPPPKKDPRVKSFDDWKAEQGLGPKPAPAPEPQAPFQAPQFRDIREMQQRMGIEGHPQTGVPEGAEAAQVPFMITRQMEADLQVRGFTPEQINAMTPEDAHAALRGDAPAPGAAMDVEPGAGTVTGEGIPSFTDEGKLGMRAGLGGVEAPKATPDSSPIDAIPPGGGEIPWGTPVKSQVQAAMDRTDTPLPSAADVAARRVEDRMPTLDEILEGGRDLSSTGKTLDEQADVVDHIVGRDLEEGFNRPPITQEDLAAGIFSYEAAAKERLRATLGKLGGMLGNERGSFYFNPHAGDSTANLTAKELKQLLYDAAFVGAAQIHRGVKTKFAWIEAMVDAMGEGIRPHLQDGSIFMRAHEFYQKIEAEVFERTGHKLTTLAEDIERRSNYKNELKPGGRQLDFYDIDNPNGPRNTTVFDQIYGADGKRVRWWNATSSSLKDPEGNMRIARKIWRDYRNGTLEDNLSRYGNKEGEGAGYGIIPVDTIRKVAREEYDQIHNPKHSNFGLNHEGPFADLPQEPRIHTPPKSGFDYYTADSVELIDQGFYFWGPALDKNKKPRIDKVTGEVVVEKKPIDPGIGDLRKFIEAKNRLAARDADQPVAGLQQDRWQARKSRGERGGSMEAPWMILQRQIAGDILEGKIPDELTAAVDEGRTIDLGDYGVHGFHTLEILRKMQAMPDNVRTRADYAASNLPVLAEAYVTRNPRRANAIGLTPDLVNQLTGRAILGTVLGSQGEDAEQRMALAASAFVPPKMAATMGRGLLGAFRKSAKALEGKGHTFMSPNVAEGLKLGDAVERIGSLDHAVSTATVTETYKRLGIDARVDSVVGSWKDGAENALLGSHNNVTWEQLRYGAAINGKQLQQKMVGVFLEDPAGDTVLWSIPMKGSIEDIATLLDEAGISDRTLRPRGYNKVEAIIVDIGEALDDTMEKLITGNPTVVQRNRVRATRGKGDFFGHPTDRAAAADVFDGIAREYEAAQAPVRGLDPGGGDAVPAGQAGVHVPGGTPGAEGVQGAEVPSIGRRLLDVLGDERGSLEFQRRPRDNTRLNTDRIEADVPTKRMMRNVYRILDKQIDDAARGVIPVDETAAAAYKLLDSGEMSFEKLLALPEGSILNAEQGRAARILEATAYEHWNEVRRQYQSGTPVDPDAGKRLFAFLGAVSEKANAAARSEPARATGDLRNPVKGLKGQDISLDYDALKDAQEALEGGDYSNARIFALGDTIKSKEEFTKLARLARVGSHSLRELAYGSMLSAPSTLFRAAASGTFAALQIGTRAVEVQMSRPFRAFPKYFKGQYAVPGEEVDLAVTFWNTMIEQIRLWGKMGGNAGMAAAEAAGGRFAQAGERWQRAGKLLNDIRTEGAGPSKLESHEPAITAANWEEFVPFDLLKAGSPLATFVDWSGSAIRADGAALNTIDMSWRTVNRRMNLRAAARRHAYYEGHRGEKLEEMVEYYTANPNRKILREADYYGDENTLTKDFSNKVTRAIGTVITHPIVQLSGFPFMKIMIRAGEMAGVHTPGLNLLTTQWWQDTFQKGGRKAVEAQAKLAVGASFMALFGFLESQGLITGTGPNDDKIKLQMKDIQNWQQKSFWNPITGKYYSYEGMEPFTTLISIAADTSRYTRHVGWNAAGMFWAGTIAGIDNLVTQPFAMGVSNMLEVIKSEDPDKWMNFLRQRATQFYPAALRQVARATQEKTETQVRPQRGQMRGEIGTELELLRREMLKEIPGWGAKAWRDPITGNVELREHLEPTATLPKVATPKGEVHQEVGRLVRKGYGHFPMIPDMIKPGRDPSKFEIEDAGPEHKDGVRLNDDEKDRWQVLMTQVVKRNGKNLEESLRDLIKSEEYNRKNWWTDERRAHEVFRLAQSFKTAARARLLQERPALRDAMNGKAWDRANALRPIPMQLGPYQPKHAEDVSTAVQESLGR